MSLFAGTRVQGSDFAYFFVKIAVAYTLVDRFGFWYGLFIYASLSHMLDLAIQKAYKLDPMNSIDASALNDHKTNACNPLVGITFERCSGETLRTIFRKKLPDSQKRFRSRLVKKLGTYYYQEIPAPEIEQALDKAVSIRPDITTWAQICQFIASYQDDIFPDHELQWCVHIFPEFEDN